LFYVDVTQALREPTLRILLLKNKEFVPSASLFPGGGPDLKKEAHITQA
jgi:hypothetical protein